MQSTSTWPLIGNNAPNGYKHYYEHNGLILGFKRPKLKSYFTNLLKCEGDVVYLGVKSTDIEAKPIKVKGKTSYHLRIKLCCYCETPLTKGENLTKEHLIPVSRGGKGGSNLKPCCIDCNQEKGNLMLHSYIQMLEYMLDGEHNADQQNKIKTKIKNANRLATQLDFNAIYS